MLSGVAPSWSRRRRLRARFLLACRLEAGFTPSDLRLWLDFYDPLFRNEFGQF